MQLDFSGAPMIEAPLPEVWRRLLDPHAVAAAAPGVETVELIDATHFTVLCSIGLGVVSLSFNLGVEFSDIIEQTSARMRAQGSASGSVVDVNTSIALDEHGPRATQLHWQATATITGVLASFGVRLLESVVRKLTEDFWETFARQASEASA
jgi:carbon monoxide dehydrogenase subunit G